LCVSLSPSYMSCCSLLGALPIGAYALATLDYLNQDQQSFLPAVFIVSYADEDSLDLWQHFSGQWNDSFLADTGDRSKIMKLRLRSEEHTSEIQSRFELVCPLLLE